MLTASVKEARGVLEKSGDQFDKGSEKSLNGLADALDESVKGLEQTGVIRNAKNTVKKLIDDEWEKYTETENHLLNIYHGAHDIVHIESEQDT